MSINLAEDRAEEASDQNLPSVWRWGEELRATFVLAWPLVIAQVAQMALVTTDVIMMGWLGPKFLAAGTLASSLMSPFYLFGIGLVSAVAPMIAQAIGARDFKSVRRTVRQGFWVSVLLAAFLVALIWNTKAIFLFAGQTEESSGMAQVYVHYAIWHLFASFLFLVLRCLLSAQGKTKVILVITLAGIVVNGLGNYALMFGNWGFPRLELMGAGISTTFVNTVMFLIALGYILTHHRFKRYAILVRLWKPDWNRFFEIFRIGLPVGCMLTAETGLFAAATLLMGWLGTNELAAHAVALQCASIAFMIPLGISQAATIRVGLAYGAKKSEGIRKAGWVSIIMGTGFMGTTCLAFWFIPEVLVGFYLDPLLPENQVPLQLAVSYLAVAALFQLVDGGQVVTSGALRGLSDTKVPMFVAIFAYWGLGLPISYFCGFVLGWGGQGIWLGLAAGLAFVAVVFVIRFAWRERLGLVNYKSI
ncbi:MATE family efflux transporter [Kiloniella laminariae]|uniref:Multidrug-efflux transporter n=1 Tax=Kiloniella laminariae TaxID=454162 RepID=A0ABT4LE21_9PROT|nr:MATE family efflux transporter [Kiloniella laminariae]MCZ4279340.1 MATE family efflux transporter [Kiloniella laminariae]